MSLLQVQLDNELLEVLQTTAQRKVRRSVWMN